MALRSERGKVLPPLVAAVVLGAGAAIKLRQGAAPPVGPLGFRLVESSKAAGLENVHQKLPPPPAFANVAPWITAIGAHAAVVDFDGDGWMDVFLTNSAPGAPNRLFRNNHDGTFTDVAARAGLRDANGPGGNLGGSLWFDYDNDGRKDLVLFSYYCAKLFHNEGDGTFTDVTEKAGFHYCGNSFAANVIDYDDDGYLDLVIGDYFKPVDFYHPTTTKIMQDSFVNADNGGPIRVYHNDGRGHLREVPGALGIKSRGWTQAIGVYDLRGTGRPDLWFATDFGADQVYLNEGHGRFVDVSSGVRERYSRDGMSAEIADIDDDGHPVALVTNIFEPGYKLGENVMWKWLGGKRFDNVSALRGVDHCGWAWGAKFVDLANDGRLDLVVANGYVSANPRKSYWFSMGTISSAQKDVVSDAALWPPMKDASLAGYQRKCVYVNRGGRFEEAGEAVGLGDDRSDGRGVAAIDADNDGRMGVIIANAGQPVHYYKSVQAPGRHWIGFELVGTRSNRDGFGAKVALTAGGRTMTREVEPLNGFMSESDSRLHFGLGQNPRVEKAVVRWPSGLVETIADLSLDRYHRLIEGRGGADAGR